MAHSYAAKRDAFVENFERARGRGPVRLEKRTSNLFRPRVRSDSGVDADALDRVIDVDTDRCVASIEGMATYETIVDATLRHGLMPTVVPELRSITLGGATTGVGIESSSFRYGLVHETVQELEVLTGTGEVVVANPHNEHRDLFFGFPNSYGTLGYALRVDVALVPVRPFVKLRHIHVENAADFFALIADVCATQSYDDEAVDFVDATVFGAGEARIPHHLTLGSFVDDAPYVSDYAGMHIYYRSIPRRDTDYLYVRDYIWRWDTDWFWCSRNFWVQNPFVRALVPRRLLRSTTYWKILAFEQRNDVTRKIDAALGHPRREMVIQDVEVPVENAGEFLEFFQREIGISPVWVCPLRSNDPTAIWDLYPMDPSKLYVNFGFWAGVESHADEASGDRNRLIERTVSELAGSKSLYSTSYYEQDEFWALYNGEAYERLKKQYDPDASFKTLYEKCVGQV